MKTLRQFIDEADPKRTHQEWADHFGVSRSYLTEVLNGTKQASRNFISRVDVGTGGAVPPAVWFLPPQTEVA